MVSEARFVLLGEASHGTHEFYRERALITKRLIYQRGFNAPSWNSAAIVVLSASSDGVLGSKVP